MRVQATAVAGLPEVRAGDDLAELLCRALDGAGMDLRDGDVLVVSSKVVSKALGLTAPAGERDRVVAEESRRVVAQRVTARGLASIVQSRAGPVMAAAGVDGSNVAVGTVLVLPADPDAEARRLRRGVHARSGARVGVVVSDTAGRAWREGQTDFALGAAGVAVVEDLRGGTDDRGQPLEVTVRALADEVAALADLVKGKTSGTPVALVRGLAALVTADDGPGAASLLRPAAGDWFRLGHVEAVRASLRAGAVPPPPVPPGSTGQRVERAVEVALAGDARPDRWAVRHLPAAASEGTTSASVAVVSVTGPGDPASLLDLGALLQRLRSALWCEDLEGTSGPLELPHPADQGAGAGRASVHVTCVPGQGGP